LIRQVLSDKIEPVEFQAKEKIMTVKIELAESFNIPSADISESILNLLQGKQPSYKYVNTSEVKENYFTTTIKPIIWPLLLSTKFEVQIIPDGSQSKVVAKTISQPYLFGGDVFDFYNGYIRDFFSTLRNKYLTIHNTGNYEITE
jgi:hypothetical protein